jgi:deoxycytidine triphosphate deaminase
MESHTCEKQTLYKRAARHHQTKLTLLACLAWGLPLAALLMVSMQGGGTCQQPPCPCPCPCPWIWAASGAFILLASSLWAGHQCHNGAGDLCDWQIAALPKGTITPMDHGHIEPNSYDVRLSRHYTKINPDGSTEEIQAQKITLPPGGFLLAHTIEEFHLPDNIKGILQGKSSWARLGVFVEAAGLFDAGFQGTAVLELFNCGQHTVTLQEGEKIAQMSFHRGLPAALPYGKPGRQSHYQKQTGAKMSWLTSKIKTQPNP